MDEPMKLKTRKHGSYKGQDGDHEVAVTGVLANRVKSGKRRLMLTKDERKELKHQQLVERAVALFLDLETPHTWKQMSELLGISQPALKDLTKTQEFMDAYSAFYVELGHDPRLKAAQGSIADMLPTAINALRNLLTDPLTKDTVKLNVIREIIRLNGMGAPESKNNDRQELAEFLKGAGVNIQQMNVALPPDYIAHMKPSDVVEAQVRDAGEDPVLPAPSEEETDEP